MPMTVVNARVNRESVERARRVLEHEGHTLSWAIRATVEYIAHTGELPSFATGEDGDEALGRVQVATSFFESLPLDDPPEGWGDMALDRQLIFEERMVRLDEKAQDAC